MIYLDTHVLVRLYFGHTEKLGLAARRAIEKHELLASAAAVLELELLHEIGRLRPAAARVISALEQDLGLRVCDLPFRTIVHYAVGEAWSRDPFDRLIVANAKAGAAPLITIDENIHKHFPRAVW